MFSNFAQIRRMILLVIAQHCNVVSVLHFRIVSSWTGAVCYDMYYLKILVSVITCRSRGRRRHTPQRPPPQSVQILSILHTNFPRRRHVRPQRPLLGNSGSATGKDTTNSLIGTFVKRQTEIRKNQNRAREQIDNGNNLDPSKDILKFVMVRRLRVNVPVYFLSLC